MFHKASQLFSCYGSHLICLFGCLFIYLFISDLLTVSETANDVTFDEGTGINSPTNLALEATFINQNFSQQVLKRDGKSHAFPEPNPFVTEDDGSGVASVAYR